MLLGSPPCTCTGSACGSNCLPRCRRAHTAATTSSPRDTFVAESAARQRQPSVGRPVLGHSTGSRTAWRTGALRQLSTAEALIAFMQRHQAAILSRVRMLCGQTLRACTTRTGRARGSTACVRGLPRLPQTGLSRRPMAARARVARAAPS